MQEIITYLIGAVVLFIIIRRLWLTIRGEGKCGCTTCDGCNCSEGNDCHK